MLVLSLLACTCGSPTAPTTYIVPRGLDSDADVDADTDADADSDTDADTDSSPTGDTSPPVDTGLTRPPCFDQYEPNDAGLYSPPFPPPVLADGFGSLDGYDVDFMAIGRQGVSDAVHERFTITVDYLDPGIDLAPFDPHFVVVLDELWPARWLAEYARWSTGDPQPTEVYQVQPGWETQSRTDRSQTLVVELLPGYPRALVNLRLTPVSPPAACLDYSITVMGETLP